MKIKIPAKLEKYNHGNIVRAIRILNRGFRTPNRTSWKESIPDLEEPLEHIAVEVALTDLRSSWGKCLYYYRMGAKEIHLVLAPKLYVEAKEMAFILENPIPNMNVYPLPAIIKKEAKKETEKHGITVKSHKKSSSPLKSELELKIENVEKFIIAEGRPRILNPLIKVSDFEKKLGLENKIYEQSGEKKQSKQNCPIDGLKMTESTYLNNFGDKVILLVCRCGNQTVKKEAIVKWA